MKTLSLVIAAVLLGASVLGSAAEPAPAKKAAGKPPEPAKPAAPATDRVELDTTQITGNRELPRVLYVVPWKRADLGELAGKPTRSLLDEVLAPVDRDVFQRQNRYHDALQPDTAGPGKVEAADRPKGESGVEK
jgi:hypothetical protein